VLRSHTLRGPNAPKAGIRYEGLYVSEVLTWRSSTDADARYKVTGYSFHTVKGEVVYDVKLTRDMDQISMREVHTRPTSEEIDDYIEYKRVREQRQVHFQDDDQAQSLPSSPTPQPMQHDHLDTAKPMHSPSYRIAKPISIQASPGPSRLRFVELPAVPESLHFPRNASIAHSMASLTSISAPARAGEAEFDTPDVEEPDLSLSYMKQTHAYDGTHEDRRESHSNFDKRTLPDDVDTHSTMSSVSPKSQPRRIPTITPGGEASVIGTVFSPIHDLSLPANIANRKDSNVMSVANDNNVRHLPDSVAKVLDIETLSTNIDALNLVTVRKGSMGSSFCQDMLQIQHILEEVRLSDEGRTRKDSLEYLEVVEHEIEAVRDQIKVRGRELEEDPASPLGEQCLEWEKRYSLRGKG
jgi:hypothetical protein